MTTKLKPVTVYFSTDDLTYLESRAAHQECSVAQYIRRTLGLSVLARGAPIGNQNARKSSTKNSVSKAKVSVEKSSPKSRKQTTGRSKKLLAESQEKLFD